MIECHALGVFTNSYVDATPRLNSVAYPNGQTIELAYFGITNDQRLQTIWNKDSAGETLSRFDYTFDANGSIDTWTQQLGTVSTNTWNLAYDRISQLLEASVRDSTTSALLKQFIYGYDQAGNRTREQTDMSVTTANHNALNQLTNTAGAGPVRFSGQLSEPGLVSVGGSAAPVSNGTNFVAFPSALPGTNLIAVTATDYSNNSRTNTYEIVVTNSATAKTLHYDLNGNLETVVTATATNTYTWDAANRLVTITQRTGTNTLLVSEFTYDGLGRRARVVEKMDGVTNSDHCYLWVGTELAEERDATGATVTRRFFGQGEQIAGTNFFFTRDHLGSVREMTDSTSALRARYDYDPYGRKTKVAGDLDADFGFTGHYFHAGSGLHLTLFRAYDAETGRWLSRDPIEESGGLNLYMAVCNDPVNRLDRYGLYVGVDDAAFCLGGALVGAGGQLVGDLISSWRSGAWSLSGWEDYVGSAVGGAVGGEALLYTGPVGAGLAGAAAGNLTRQGLKNLSGEQSGFNLKNLAVETAVGGATGFVPGARIPGITAGRGSYNQVYNQITTKAQNGTISSVSAQTAGKMFVGRSAATGLIPGTGVAAAAAGCGLTSP